MNGLNRIKLKCLCFGKSIVLIGFASDKIYHVECQLINGCRFTENETDFAKCNQKFFVLLIIHFIFLPLSLLRRNFIISINQLKNNMFF